MLDAGKYHAKAIELDKLAVQMTAQAGSGHPSSSVSLGHIVSYLMYGAMRFDPAKPHDLSSDRLVLSEGHAVPIVYAALADLGAAVGKPGEPMRALRVSDVDSLRDLPSVLDGHPNPAEGVPFFDAATGSLGQGLSVAAGLAIGARLDDSPRRIFCIIGDGESREGQIWEAADFIADHKLQNVCAIFNANGQGQTGHVSEQQSPERLAEKLRAFGWEVAVIDGHNPVLIAEAVDKFQRSPRPLAIVARTVKGWGVDELLNGNWHGKPLPVASVAKAAESLDRAAKTMGATSADGLKPHATASSGKTRPRIDPAKAKWPSFEDAMKAAGFGGPLEKKTLATRKAYGAGLKAAGEVLPQLVVLDADVSNSTFSELFAKAYPDRFIECKIAEQNMISVAAGLSSAGFLPFANTFSKFFARAYDQIEMANISRANIKLVGSHSGISLAADGPSQMALVDVAFFRAIGSVKSDDRQNPQCWLYQPADAVSAYAFTRLMTIAPGMCYMRTHRPEVAFLYAPDASFEPGGLNLLAPGDEMAIVASGYMVHVAREALQHLSAQNRRVGLIDAYCLPLREDKLIELLQKCGKRALVVEDNYGGGFSGAVAEAAARHGGMTVRSLYCQRMPKSAREPHEILEYCGVSARQVADQALAMLAG